MQIVVIRREYEPGKFTSDIAVDGEVVVRAVGDVMLPEIVRRLRAAGEQVTFGTALCGASHA